MQRLRMIIKVGIITICLCYFYSGLYATGIVSTEKIEVGRYISTGEKLFAEKLTFSDNLVRWYHVNSKDYIVFILRGLKSFDKSYKDFGILGVYDIKFGSVRWTMRIYTSHIGIIVTDNYIFLPEGTRTTVLNIRNGQTRDFLRRKRLLMIDSEKNIAYSLGRKSGKTVFERIELGTWDSNWRRYLKFESPIENVQFLNDSMIILIANGLFCVNINHGNGWEYISETRNKNQSDIAIETAKSVFMGAMFGLIGVMISNNLGINNNVISGIHSNILQDENSVYFAGRYKISKLDKRFGVEIWTYSLPSELTGRSLLFFAGDTVMMINGGYAFSNNYPINYGLPFMAAYCRKTGKEFYLISYEDKNAGSVLSYNFNNTEINLLYRNKIVFLNVSNYNDIIEKPIDTLIYGKPTHFLSKSDYSKFLGKDYKQMQFSGAVFFTEKDYILRYSKNSDYPEVILPQDYYFGFMRINKFNLIEQNSQSLILDENNNTIVETVINSSWTKAGKYLFKTSSNSLSYFNTEQIITKP